MSKERAAVCQTCGTTFVWYGSNDIGAAITQPMVDEYREATEAKAAGHQSRRLWYAALVCQVLLYGGALYMLITAVT